LTQFFALRALLRLWLSDHKLSAESLARPARESAVFVWWRPPAALRNPWNPSFIIPAMQTVECMRAASPAGAKQDSPGRKPWEKRNEATWSPAWATPEMRIASVAAASAYAHAAPERDRSGCRAALSGLALTTRFSPGLTPWAVLFRPLRGSPLSESQVYYSQVL